MGRKKIAILYGGSSVEHDVSIRSAKNIAQFMDKKLFEPILIGITEKGTWHHTKSVAAKISDGEKISVQLKKGEPTFKTKKKKFTVDIVFPVLHGTDGEDGSVQGLLQALGLPMVGTGVLGSAMAMNKLITKRIWKETNLPIADFLFCHYADRKKLMFEKIEKELGLPFMVKSANLGSSVGVSKVNSKKDFAKAVESGFRYDHCILFEKYIEGREIECAVLGNSPPKASLPGEVILDKEKYAFYSFDAKYVDANAATIQVPAKLDSAVVKKIREFSVRAFETLACEDFARVDLFLTSSGDVFLNEINTIPGFTDSSMFPMLWKERGISFKNLITQIIALAEKRFELTQRMVREYSSGLKK